MCLYLFVVTIYAVHVMVAGSYLIGAKTVTPLFSLPVFEPRWLTSPLP